MISSSISCCWVECFLHPLNDVSCPTWGLSTPCWEPLHYHDDCNTMLMFLCGLMSRSYCPGQCFPLLVAWHSQVASQLIMILACLRFCHYSFLFKGFCLILALFFLLILISYFIFFDGFLLDTLILYVICFFLFLGVDFVPMWWWCFSCFRVVYLSLYGFFLSLGVGLDVCFFLLKAAVFNPSFYDAVLFLF